MSSKLRTARKQLKYPLYGADFDPLNPDFLLVGGGGGSTSSGVPNKITLLDASRLDTLNEISDIELAKDEDSVTCLAIAESNDAALTAYAGINGSIKEQEAGKNEHFRSFRIGLPAKKRKADGSEKTTPSSFAGPVKTQALIRSALFKPATSTKGEAYQRVLRVAPPHKSGGDRVAAIASGLAIKNEVIVLRATPSPSLSNVISRIDIDSGEAADLDIVPTEDQTQSFALAYCTDYDVYLQNVVLSSGAKEPNKVYSAVSGPKRSKIRCLRWLNSRYLLLLANRPAGGGANLAILKTDKDYTQAKEVLVKTLTKSTKQAVGLATCALSTSPKGEQQFLVAVAGQDSSIEILSIDLIPGTGVTKFRQFEHLREVHSGPITRIIFSTFIPPTLPVTNTTKPQYIRLASVGVDQKVVVQTLPLRPYPATYTKEPRYVLTPPPETAQNAINIFVALFVVGLVAFCLQVFCEIRGVLPPTLHAQSWLSPEWRSKIASPYYHLNQPVSNMPGPAIVESMPPVVSEVISAATETATQVATLLHDMVAEQKDNPDQKIVMRDSSTPDDQNVEFAMHHADSDAVKGDETIKKWEHLSEKEKKGWKKRLIEAGHWTEKQGESVLKGILFSELGAAVGAAMRG